jgi:hypothetical protein
MTAPPNPRPIPKATGADIKGATVPKNAPTGVVTFTIPFLHSPPQNGSAADITTPAARPPPAPIAPPIKELTIKLPFLN